MSQFAAFSPFELPSFEKVKKGCYHRVGGKELAGRRWKEHLCVCVCVCAEDLLHQLGEGGMWGILVGTENFEVLDPPGKNLPLLKTLRATSGIIPLWIGHL